MLRKILQSRFFTVLAVLVLAFLGLRLVSIQSPISDLSKESANINQKISEAKQKNEALDQQAQYLTSQSYLERQARIKLNYKNPDEEAIQIYRVVVASKSVEEIKNSIFAKIGNWFKNLAK